METINEAEIWVNAGTFCQKLFANPKRKGFVVRCKGGSMQEWERREKGYVCLKKIQTHRGDHKNIYIIAK